MSTFDQKLKVTLGGLSQKIHILSDDRTRPVLLFLHGGPGVINRHSVIKNHADLLDTFTIAAWDQRGSGGSYWGTKKETLTVKQLTDDAAELVEWLCKFFGKDKIFIIGGSWGSELGTHLAYRYPAKIAAYVGFGQVADGPKNETISYQFALKAAQNASDNEAVKCLGGIGPPENGVYKGGFEGLMAQRKIMMKYGGYSPDKKRRGMFSSFVKPILFSGEYSLGDIIGVVKGYKFVLRAMWAGIAGASLAKECPKFKIPYFIFDGRLDNNTPASLVEEYFAAIEAPRKELIWFEKSGHNPMNDEPVLFKNTLRAMLTEVARDEQKKGVIV
ncbi:MAG: alpha/beta hydrolase [Treponema sp.]|jgi:pimeloyl-ACP methyl ester carboxylesterase|nr:alpha/beta hydrolase [Treponema sp.]